jgi:hypothetical protein
MQRFRNSCRAAIILGLFILVRASVADDVSPFRITVKEAPSQPAPALQSFAYGVSGGKWLFVGGRTNGFHRTSDRERTFPSRYANKYIHVVDPAKDIAWKVGLPASVKQSLSATNPVYYQDGNVLYVIGGYGSSNDKDLPQDYQTFPTLTAIRLPEVIQAITSGHNEDVAANIVSIADERMRVTGGEMVKLGSNFYLCLGQNYDAIYKGAYTGKYTGEVRRFGIEFSGKALSITDYVAFADPNGPGPASQYHRRDLVAIEAVRPDGSPGITLLGGVFTNLGGTWVNPILIDQDSTGNTKITVDGTFDQKMSQYNCAVLTISDPAARTMFVTLFGGISLYYYDAQGRLTPSSLDNFTPFISSITTQVRRADGTTIEYPQAPADSLPGFLGANAVFIPLDTLPRCAGTRSVLDYSKLPNGPSVLLGHIYGGIRATAPQASEFNPTYANNVIYEVYLERPAQPGAK